MLTKADRENLPDEEFAVPQKRALPIHDEKHVKMAIETVDKTKNLTPEERAEAEIKIEIRANELGIKTDKLKTKVVEFNAMALDFPAFDTEHPNKIPFSGVLTRLDEPSDKAPIGGNAKRIFLSKAVAEKALPSLIGMGVNFTAVGMDAHDKARKVGLICGAEIQDQDLLINGFLYGADSPAEVQSIQANKKHLGFSFEAQTILNAVSDDPLVIRECVFTGAAILLKNKAAYSKTSLHAQAETLNMDELNSLKAQMEILKQELSETKIALQAAASVMDKVKPHSNRIRNAADMMETAGIGMHPSAGHVAALRNMAAAMDGEAMQGKVPHRMTDGMMMASTEPQVPVQPQPNPEVEKLQREVEALKKQIDEQQTAKSFAAAAEPQRKTLPPQMTKILAKAGIESSDAGLDINTLNQAFNKAGTGHEQRMILKAELAAKGMIKDAGAI